MNVKRYLGEIRGWAGNERVPEGWALCEGQHLKISANPTLFNLIGATYGGDGQSTFALPDMRGRMPFGLGMTKDGISYNEGLKGGVESVSLTVAQFPKHTHDPWCSSEAGNSDSPANNYWAKGTSLNYNSEVITPDASMSTQAIQSAGKGTPHDNMPPYFAFYFIICLDGENPLLPV